MPRREPRPLQLAGDLPFPKEDLMPSTAGKLSDDVGFKPEKFGNPAPVAGMKAPTFARGGRRGVIRFPYGSKQFTEDEVKRGYRVK